MFTSGRWTKDHIVIERESGTRGADGFQATGSETVLDADGDAQSYDLDAEATPSGYDRGAVRFFAEAVVDDCRTGDEATVELESGDVIEGTVATIRPDDDSILISYERRS